MKSMIMDKVGEAGIGCCEVVCGQRIRVSLCPFIQ